MNYIYAADRDIGVRVLELLIDRGYRPDALLLPETGKASHGEQLRQLCRLPEERILEGPVAAGDKALERLHALKPDYLLGVHYPLILPESLLALPSVGCVNLHPAWLPCNRGWHTPSWAILEATPAGATLHLMNERIDGGDILGRRRVKIDPSDTADSLYWKIKQAEFELFREMLPVLAGKDLPRQPQSEGEGSFHRKSELFSDDVQKIDLDRNYRARDLIDKLRALTTSEISEAAWFHSDGRKFRIRVSISEEEGGREEKGMDAKNEKRKS